jgi:hypothetical protein
MINVGDIIHRLRVRSHEARNAGQPAIADELRAAIRVIEELEREVLLARRAKAELPSVAAK